MSREEEIAVVLRPMRAEDLPAAIAIAAASPEAPQWREADYGAYLKPEVGTRLQRLAIMIEADGRPVGLAAATLLPDGMENRCELDTIAVDPGARRRGVGRALLEAAMSWAAARGARKMGLEVRASNIAAQMLYRSLGFAEEGRRAGYYRNPEEDALLLGTLVTAVSPTVSISTDKEVEGPASQC